MIAENMKAKVAGNSVIRQMFEEGKAMAKVYGAENVYDFSLGNPNIPAPASVNKAILDILENEDPLKVHGYMSNAGFEETRQAIADDLNARFGTSYRLENVILTAGAGSAMNIALKTLLNPGDEVLVFAPYFVEYRNYIGNYYAETVEVPPLADGSFLPDVAGMEARITEKTKAVILNSPNNPTGVIYPVSVIRELAAALQRGADRVGHPIYIISDEPYRELVYDDQEVAHLPSYYADTVIGYSFSKSLSLPGERLGYLLVPDASHEAEEFITAATIANRISGIVNAPSLIQLAIARCLKEKADLDFYAKNGAALYDGLTKMGYDCLKPQGAFYLWVKAPCEEQAFVKALKEEHILVTPGSAFAGPGYVRISYCVAHETILNSMPGFRKVMEACQR